MVLEHRDVPGLGHTERFVPGPVRHLVGEDQQGVDVLELGADIDFRPIENPQVDAGLRRFLPVVALQSIHPAY
jgi:hypothetical protein